MSEPELEPRAYQAALRAQGKITLAGPFDDDRPDDSWRGLTMYNTALEEARALAAQDPAVLAGRFAVDVFTWWTPTAARLRVEADRRTS